jgi:hypothetical protein
VKTVWDRFGDGSVGIVRQNQFSWGPNAEGVNVNEPSPSDRTIALRRAAIALLIAAGLVGLLVTAIYLSYLDGPVGLKKDVAQYFVGP